MKGDRVFFDTNVLIYAFAENDPRTGIAEALLAGGGVTGVQALNEFVTVAALKLAMPWEEVLEALRVLRVLCPSPVPVTVHTHEAALRIMGQFRYHIYDSLVIAAALEARCQTLFSEDMQDGQTIGGLTIRNPFAGTRGRVTRRSRSQPGARPGRRRPAAGATARASRAPRPRPGSGPPQSP